MAAQTLLHLQQYYTTQLSVVGGIDATQTDSIVIQSVAGIDGSVPGIALLEYSDPLGDNYEWIEYESINSTTKTFVGVTRGAEGGSGKRHDNGVIVAFPISESHVNRLADALSIGGVATNGVETTLDEDDMASDSATALVTQQSVKAMHDTGWTAITETLTYDSPTTITVAAGAASRYQKGDKLKITQTTDKYFYIVGVADTVLTVTGGIDYTLTNDPITSPQLSRIENPFGFPNRFQIVSDKIYFRVVGGELIINGWGYQDPLGTNLRTVVGVSFGMTFSTVPVVIVSPLGQASGTINSIDDFTYDWGSGTGENRFDAVVTTISTTGCKVLLSGNTHPTDVFGFTFEARGLI